MGLYVHAGSRFETQRTAGASHLIDRLTFSVGATVSSYPSMLTFADLLCDQSSQNRSHEDFVKTIGALGGQFTSTSSRETMIAQATCFTHDLSPTLSLLSDTLLNPLILPSEVDRQRDAAAWEIAEITSKPELIMPELLHEVAYKQNTLGMPLLCPEQQLTALSPELLRAYHAEWYRPERMAIAAAGVDHEDFVKLVEEMTGPVMAARESKISAGQQSSAANQGSRALHTSSSNSASVLSSLYPQEPTYQELANAQAKYTGGASYASDPQLEFTHLYVAYESVPVTSLPETYALAVLQTLLGGGNAFSAGGPGKGMYSRLYTRVLNQHWKVDFCAAFNHSYLDSGLFGMGIAVSPDYAREAPRIIAQQLDTLTHPPNAGGLNEEELRRAKNQLKSSLMMNLESRAMQVEDLARQVLAHGHKTSAEEMCQHIDQVQLSDLRDVAQKVLRDSGKEPSIVARGHMHGMGDVRDTLKRYGLAPK